MVGLAVVATLTDVVVVVRAGARVGARGEAVGTSPGATVAGALSPAATAMVAVATAVVAGGAAAADEKVAPPPTTPATMAAADVRRYPHSGPCIHTQTGLRDLPN